MKKVIIIDDEPLAITLIREYLVRYHDLSVVATALNGFDGLKAINEHKPDLLFLDVQMPKLTGFELIELLENPPDIIFTTAFDEYAVQAFEANAIDYLLKPFTEDRFTKSIEKWRQRVDTGSKPDLVNHDWPSKRFVVKSGNHIRILEPREILYVEAYDDYIKINIPGDCFLKKQTMQRAESVLGTFGFIRVHRSFLVNPLAILRIELNERDHYSAILTDQSRIPLSKAGLLTLKTKMDF